MDYFFKHGKIFFKHKFWEFQLSNWAEGNGLFLRDWFKFTIQINSDINIFCFDFSLLKILNIGISLTRKTDHAGLSIDIDLTNLFCLYFVWYDHRHYDEENNKFVE